jgi:hypothetical protein
MCQFGSIHKITIGRVLVSVAETLIGRVLAGYFPQNRRATGNESPQEKENPGGSAALAAAPPGFLIMREGILERLGD